MVFNQDVFNNQSIFCLSYWLTKKSPVITYYKHYMKTQWWSYDKLLKLQLDKLRQVLRFVKEEVPYFTTLFHSIGFEPDDLRSFQDLEKLPVMDKRIIKQYWSELKPRNYHKMKYILNTTGGSTGQPLKYLMSLDDKMRGIALLYRGWSYGDYKLGNKMALIAGSSIIKVSKSPSRAYMMSILRNRRTYSADNLSEEMLFSYLESLNKFKPEFLRGYASSIYTLATFIRENNYKLNFKPRTVFTTAEKLLDGQRRTMEDVFDTIVLDNYGLNDGGVSAYECKEQSGLHIDMERAILEVVDENNKQIIGKPGRIIATNLYNYALPFIRYDTGDLGIISTEDCTCGRQLPLLKEIVGRSNDVLVIKGKQYRVPVSLFGKMDIEQYQLIQEGEDRITCKIVKGKSFTDKDEVFIQQSLVKLLGNVSIKIKYVSEMTPVNGNKHKFIIKI